MRRHLDIPVAFLCVGGSAAAVVFSDFRPLRIAAASLLLLVLPGLLASLVIFPMGTIGGAQRLLLSLALSLSLAALAALVLQLTIGLRTTSWAGVLAVMECAMYLAARYRPRPTHRPWPLWLPRVRTIDVLAVTVAALLLVVAVALARTPLRATKVHGYTALWLLRRNEGMDVVVGLRSAELTTASYHLVVRAEGRVLYDHSFKGVVPGEQVEKRLLLPPRVREQANSVEALLFLEDRPRAVYRRATLTFGAPD